MRLNKYLARAGVASRRASDKLILGGRVRLDGKIVRELGTVVGDDTIVEVDGKHVHAVRDFTYVLMHKPAGVMTTMRDPQGRRTVADLFPKHLPRLVPVGRLDFDTAGLLLFTDDGDLANHLLHPRYGIDKTYRAVISGMLSVRDIRALEHGIQTSEFLAAPAIVHIITKRGTGMVLDITIHEGRNRQIRKMFDAIGHPVVALTRLRFGPLRLGRLQPAQVRLLTAPEVAKLRSIAGGVPSTVSKGGGRRDGIHIIRGEHHV